MNGVCCECGAPKSAKAVYCTVRCRQRAKMKRRRSLRGDVERQCGGCLVTFPPSTNKRYCSTACRNAAERRRYGERTGDASHRRSRLEKRLAARYGLTYEAYESLWRAQGEACAICRTTTPTTRGWCVDHHHGTGHVRGILCSPCNAGIGLLGDDPERIAAAVAYVWSGGVTTGWGVSAGQNPQVVDMIPLSVIDTALSWA